MERRKKELFVLLSLFILLGAGLFYLWIKKPGTGFVTEVIVDKESGDGPWKIENVESKKDKRSDIFLDANTDDPREVNIKKTTSEHAIRVSQPNDSKPDDAYYNSSNAPSPTY